MGGRDFCIFRNGKKEGFGELQICQYDISTWEDYPYIFFNVAASYIHCADAVDIGYIDFNRIFNVSMTF